VGHAVASLDCVTVDRPSDPARTLKLATLVGAMDIASRSGFDF
jgi:hypothetical protein